eukprot:TRINITY_DN103553_c0_g1_i1.p1 TRINITY_DN103553_c0_g1~~TRINITY_DN103553_c0_g1_i1.p1  ORF type:complete len:306 (+),score=43.56 TRINITY_DN103553_c0_g1_i1:48-965(+)
MTSVAGSSNGAGIRERAVSGRKGEDASTPAAIPTVSKLNRWDVGAFTLSIVAGVACFVHLYFRWLIPAQPHNESWRKGCRQCRQDWWDEFWHWRLKELEDPAEDSPPPEGHTWEWGNATVHTDWFNASSEVVDLAVKPYVPAGEPVLQIGCGDSPIASLLYQAGFLHIENIDISPHIVNLMRKRYPEAEYPGMTFDVRDFLARASVGGGPPPPLHRFAAVIDKAGIWDWLQDERHSALPRLMASVRDALIERRADDDEPGMYIITTKQTPRDLQRSLMEVNMGFAVDATIPLTGGIAWAYILVPT